MRRFGKIFFCLLLSLFSVFSSVATTLPVDFGGDEYKDLHRSEHTYIEIRSNPNGAAVYVDGKYQGVTPLRAEVRPDVNHKVEVEKPGWRGESKNVFASRGSVSSVSFYLDEIPSAGSIHVSVKNASGCSVYLDGSYKGKSPLTIKDLKPGRYKIRVSKPNFPDEYKTVTVASGENVRAEFSLSMGELWVHSPGVSGASVYVDGKYKGTTPYHGSDIEPGTHELKVTKSHYKSYVRKITLRSGYIQSVNADLEKLAELYVRTTNTTGASVYINGRSVGSTPYHGEDFESGYYTVRLVKKHYRTEEFSVFVDEGRTKNVNYEMTKISGYLDVSAYPSSAKITVDGQTYSRSMELDEGIHQLRAQCFGYEDMTQSVEIIRNRHQSLDLSLVPRRFEILSFFAESSPGGVKFKWSVTAEGSGVISVRDSSGAEIVSWNVELVSWKEYIEWDRKIAGVPVENGSYTAVLCAAGDEVPATFVVSGGGDSFSKQRSLDSAREKVRGEMEKASPSKSAADLTFFSMDNVFESERNGLFFSLDCGFKSDGDYEAGGTFTVSWSPIPFTIFGAEGTFTRGKNSSYPSADFSNFASGYVIAGLTGTFGAIRPYVYVGAGYCGYFALPGDLKSSDGGNMLASGLSMEIVPGIDFIFGKWSLGAFFRGRQDMETGNYGMFGLSVGIDLW